MNESGQPPIWVEAKQKYDLSDSHGGLVLSKVFREIGKISFAPNQTEFLPIFETQINDKSPSITSRIAHQKLLKQLVRAVASGGARGEIAPPLPKPANNFLKRPNLRARLRADSLLSSFSKLKSREMHF